MSTMPLRNESRQPNNRLGQFLRELRLSQLIPNAEAAALMERKRPSVCKLEKQPDYAWTMFSLQRYAEAIGGRVRITVVLDSYGDGGEFSCDLAAPPESWRSKWARRDSRQDLDRDESRSGKPGACATAAGPAGA